MTVCWRSRGHLQARTAREEPFLPWGICHFGTLAQFAPWRARGGVGPVGQGGTSDATWANPWPTARTRAARGWPLVFRLRLGRPRRVLTAPVAAGHERESRPLLLLSHRGMAAAISAPTDTVARPDDDIGLGSRRIGMEEPAAITPLRHGRSPESNPSRESVTPPSRMRVRAHTQRGWGYVTDSYRKGESVCFSLYFRPFTPSESVTKARDGFVTDWAFSTFAPRQSVTGATVA